MIRTRPFNSASILIDQVIQISSKFVPKSSLETSRSRIQKMLAKKIQREFRWVLILKAQEGNDT